MRKKPQVRIIGAGLAGSEACYQLAKRGIAVELVEMRPHTMTPAHVSGDFAELVCSNSFRSDDMTNAAGLLKEEMRLLDSLIVTLAQKHRLPAGSALAVDRIGFSQEVTAILKAMHNVSIVHEEITDLDDTLVTLIATGPLTSSRFSAVLKDRFGHDELYFYDAVAPIINVDSIDFSMAYRKSRYDKGTGQDYINCPMNADEFHAFYQALIQAEQAERREFEDLKVFEGCMPVEEMAKRGIKTLLFGPMKPVGLTQPDGTKPFAVVQLRQDNAAGSLYNMVGFQTRLKWPEQKRVIRMIPGLQNAEIVRYGVMHRNTFINAPHILNRNYQSKSQPSLFFAGQITGVEGYIESAGSGLLAALNVFQYLNDRPLLNLSNQTVLGAMSYYVAHAGASFQPMNANFGLVGGWLKDRSVMAKRSLDIVGALHDQISQ